MERYKNHNGHSGVTAYSFGDDHITVQFTNGTIYLYDYRSTGRDNVEQMKKLAADGRGLSTFIAQHVRNHFGKQLK